MKQEEKLKALDAALVKIEKDYGKGSVMKLGEYQADRTIEVTPTGSISLDIALGVGVEYLRDVSSRFMDLNLVVRQQ